jgi:hypothetical protein
MRAYFQDYYGQHIHINNETASGNIRMRVVTCKDLNRVKCVKEDECDLETDISLNEVQLNMLIAALQNMVDD